MGNVIDMRAYLLRRLHDKYKATHDPKISNFLLNAGYRPDVFCHDISSRSREYIDQDYYTLPVELGRDILGDRFAALVNYAYTRITNEEDLTAQGKFYSYMELLGMYIRRSAEALELHHKYRKGCRIGQWVMLGEEKAVLDELYLALCEGW